MSKLKQSIHLGRLEKILSASDDEAFLQLVWAVDALQSNRVDAAKKYIKFSTSAASSDIGSSLAIHRWELEALVNMLLMVPKLSQKSNSLRSTNCDVFATCAFAVNRLRKLEDAESALYLGRLDIFAEMHRIGQRQIHWQRGYFNAPQLYRYAYLYGGELCSAYFENTHGLSPTDFMAIGFGLYAGFRQEPVVRRGYSLEYLGVNDSARELGLSLASILLSEARPAALALTNNVNANRPHPLPVAYQPSLLRRYPILKTSIEGGYLRCPLPELILQRVTSGIYYDLVGGPGELRNEASGRFEIYAQNLLNKMLPGLQLSQSFKYRADGNRIDSPDIIIQTDGMLDLVIECKATKLSIGAQFSEDPIEETKSAYQELAKGVFQLWKFFSHVRRGLCPDLKINDAAKGLVLTLDSWLIMSSDLQDRVIAEARTLSRRDKNIIDSDCRAILFCSISDLEQTLARSDERSFLRCLSAATGAQYHGWALPVVNRDLSEYKGSKKPYPFSLADVLPWWGKVR